MSEVKNEQLFLENKFKQVESTNFLPLDLNSDTRLVKGAVSVSLTNDNIMLYITSIFKVENTKENIEKINKLNDLLVELINGSTNKKWIGR